MASPEVLQKRAQRGARNIMRSRIAKGQSVASMSPGQKIMLATRLEKFLPKIKKMAKRLVKVKRQQELQRKRKNKTATPGQKG
jgi:50S ribosomal subunit-associated GTPase HflX